MERAASLLESVVIKSLHRASAHDSAVLAWPVACGTTVAERTRVMTFCDGVLQIEVSDMEWRRELSQLAPRYLAAINKYSTARVERIEFVVKR